MEIGWLLWASVRFGTSRCGRRPVTSLRCQRPGSSLLGVARTSQVACSASTMASPVEVQDPLQSPSNQNSKFSVRPLLFKKKPMKVKSVPLLAPMENQRGKGNSVHFVKKNCIIKMYSVYIAGTVTYYGLAVVV